MLLYINQINKKKSNKVKELDKKNCTYYFCDNIINIKSFI